MTREWVRPVLTTVLLAVVLAGGLGGRHVSAARQRSAEIINSGSTNSGGYRMVVCESGRVKYEPGKPPHVMGPRNSEMNKEVEVDVGTKLTTKLFEDLDQAAPLSRLPVVHCIKSASFGTTTVVSVGRERSPDLSCPGADHRMEALYKDVEAILGAIRSYSRH
ncbi:MAG TPA: hypothetical protein VJX67_06355 [Blastocatellia bacterium]|nr:hypothetical protein [Blastocatellia bacterium]